MSDENRNFPPKIEYESYRQFIGSTMQDFPADAREVPSAGKRAPSKWNLPVGGWFFQGAGLTAQAMRSLHHKCRKTGELKGGVYKVFQTESGDVYVRRES